MYYFSSISNAGIETYLVKDKEKEKSLVIVVAWPFRAIVTIKEQYKVKKYHDVKRER